MSGVKTLDQETQELDSLLTKNPYYLTTYRNISLNYFSRGDIKTSVEWHIKSDQKGKANAEYILEKNEVKD